MEKVGVGIFYVDCAKRFSCVQVYGTELQAWTAKFKEVVEEEEGDSDNWTCSKVDYRLGSRPRNRDGWMPLALQVCVF